MLFVEFASSANFAPPREKMETTDGADRVDEGMHHEGHEEHEGENSWRVLRAQRPEHSGLAAWREECPLKGARTVVSSSDARDRNDPLTQEGISHAKAQSRKEGHGCDPCASVFIRGGNQKDMNHG
jgi:hypothetical protein